MKKQTAIECLLNSLKDYASNFNTNGQYFIIKIEKKDMVEIISKTKAMEKDQIINAHGTKVSRTIKQGIDIYETISGEQYYNQTYNK